MIMNKPLHPQKEIFKQNDKKSLINKYCDLYRLTTELDIVTIDELIKNKLIVGIRDQKFSTMLQIVEKRRKDFEK